MPACPMFYVNLMDRGTNMRRTAVKLLWKQKATHRKYFDYSETIAPVARITTTRIILAIVTQKDYHTHQMDVQTAFLGGNLKDMTPKVN